MARGVINICITHNNYNAADEERYRSLVPDIAQYVLLGREVGESGTPHLQGFIQLRKATGYPALHRMLPGAHISGTRTVPGSIKYCKKDGDFVEYGECPRTSNSRSGAKNGEISQYIQQHGVRKARKKYMYEWASRGHIIMRNLHMPGKYRLDIECMWFFGSTGTGKSHLAHQILPRAYRKNSRTKWFHGYEFERGVIMDDMAPGGIAIDYLLRWFDKYPCRVETKGGEMELYAEQWIVTSNFLPEEVFAGNPHLPALRRRIQIVVFNGATPETRTINWNPSI